MSKHTQFVLGTLAVVVIIAIGVGMGFATGRWVATAGLLVGVIPIGVYGLFMAVAGKKVAEGMAEDADQASDPGTQP